MDDYVLYFHVEADLTLVTDTRIEDLTHPEDIAHFAKHDQEEDEEEQQQKLDRMSIVDHNIPQKFRRNP